MAPLTERQIEILRSALDLISEKGIQNLTTKNLASRIGITEPALYRHFRNKITILTTILQTYQKTVSGIADEINQSADPPLDKIRRFFRSIFKQFVENPSLTSVIFAEEIFRNEKKLTRSVLEIMRLAHQIIAQWIATGQKKKQIRDDLPPEHLVFLLMGVHRLLVTRWRMSDFGFDLLAEQSRIWKSLEKIYVP